MVSDSTTVTVSAVKVDKDSDQEEEPQAPDIPEIKDLHPIPLGTLDIIPQPKQSVSYICIQCNITLPNQLSFLTHLNTVHNDTRRYTCQHCGKKFVSVAQRRSHETIHNPHRFKGEPQFSCNLCDKKYHIKGSLDTHKLYAHLCRKRAFKKRQCQPLQNQHSTGQGPFKCDTCSLSYTHRTSLYNHKKMVHENPSSPLNQKTLTCPYCPRQFSLSRRLKDHLTVHTGELPHKCNFCEMRFRTRSVTMSHQKLHIASPLNTFKCRVCGKEGFKRYDDYKKHRKNSHAEFPHQHENEKPFGCGICGKPYFLRESAIICAMLKHDPTRLLEKMFQLKCSECPEEYLGHRNLLTLRKHWEVEHGDKPIPAKYRLGMQNKNLKDELPTVTLDKVKAREIKENGIPPEVKYEFPLYVEFDLLGTSFQKQTGNPVRPYRQTILKCSICDEEFRNERKFKLHQLHVHEKVDIKTAKYEARKSFRECELCNMKFGDGSNFNRHLKSKRHLEMVGSVGVDPLKVPVHPTEKITEFPCPICGKMLATRKTLKKHQLKIHVNGEKRNAKFEAKRLPRECKVCDMKFVNGSNLKIHLSSKQHLFNLGKGKSVIIKCETDEPWTNGEPETGCENPGDDDDDIDTKESTPVIVSVASVKQEVHSENSEVNGFNEWLDINDLQVKMEPIEPFEIQSHGEIFANGEVSTKRKRGQRKRSQEMETSKPRLSRSVMPSDGIKRKPGRPFGTTKKKLSTLGSPSIPKPDDANIQSEGKQNVCFICGFQASSVIILRRHLMSQHIDRNDSKNYTDQETKCSVNQIKTDHLKVDKDYKDSNKFATVNLNDLDGIKCILGNKEMRLILTRVDNDSYDFSDSVLLK